MVLRHQLRLAAQPRRHRVIDGPPHRIERLLPEFTRPRIGQQPDRCIHRHALRLPRDRIEIRRVLRRLVHAGDEAAHRRVAPLPQILEKSRWHRARRRRLPLAHRIVDQHQPRESSITRHVDIGQRIQHAERPARQHHRPTGCSGKCADILAAPLRYSSAARSWPGQRHHAPAPDGGVDLRLEDARGMHQPGTNTTIRRAGIQVTQPHAALCGTIAAVAACRAGAVMTAAESMTGREDWRALPQPPTKDPRPLETEPGTYGWREDCGSVRACAAATANTWSAVAGRDA